MVLKRAQKTSALESFSSDPSRSPQNFIRRAHRPSAKSRPFPLLCAFVSGGKKHGADREEHYARCHVEIAVTPGLICEVVPSGIPHRHLFRNHYHFVDSRLFAHPLCAGGLRQRNPSAQARLLEGLRRCPLARRLGQICGWGAEHRRRLQPRARRTQCATCRWSFLDSRRRAR